MKWLAKRYWVEGDRARDRGSWHEAVNSYRTALRWHTRRPGLWLQYGHALRESGNLPSALEAYSEALALAPQSYAVHTALLQYGQRTGTLDRLGFVILGTTGLCNASCVHCPTNKIDTQDAPRTPMAMPLFHRIIDELVDSGLPIFGQIAFGLFGDALLDPHVVARARYVRNRFPDVPLSINTNGAGFDLERHGALRDAKPVIALHCESLHPETFHALMSPLRLERVILKYEQILCAFPGKVRVTVPVNRCNKGELADIRSWFEERGATLLFAPLASRCADDRSVFDRLAFSPSPMRCSSIVLEDLVIDCDGTVLSCCQDFKRDEPIGNLLDQSLISVLNGELRSRRATQLNEFRHGESVTCSKCFVDPMPAVPMPAR